MGFAVQGTVCFLSHLANSSEVAVKFLFLFFSFLGKSQIYRKKDYTEIQCFCFFFYTQEDCEKVGQLKDFLARTYFVTCPTKWPHLKGNQQYKM